MNDRSFRIAAVQAAPIFMDLEATVTKACDLIEEAAAGGATLAVFPEAFIPGYPLWVWFVPPGHTHPLRSLYAELHRNSVAIPGPEIGRIALAAARCRITVALGVNERNAEASNSTLYNSLVYIGSDGQEGILYADVEPHQLIGPRWQLDIAGHYGRPELFELRVHRQPRPFVKTEAALDRNEGDRRDAETGPPVTREGSAE